MTEFLSAEKSEQLAIDALSFIAGHETLLERFFAISGTSPANLRESAAQPGFLAAVLNFLLNHAPDLMAFCEDSNYQPQEVARAFAQLSGTETNGC